MKKKINIAELLKGVPKGMELYSPIFGEVYLDKIRHHLTIVVTTDKKQGDFKEEFLYDGRYEINGECMLYPSKGKTTWEGFVPPCKFKVGDKITDKNKFIYRITEITDKGYKLHDLKTTFITFEEADLYFVKVVDIFDINTLKPFESRVLVRDINTDKWIGAFYSHCKSNGKKFYTIGSSYYYQYIPYEGNEHLLDTTDDCDEYFKNW